MKSILRSCCLIIFLLALLVGLYIFANPSTIHKTTDRINQFIENIETNKSSNILSKIFTKNQTQISNTPILMYHHVKNHKESDDEVEKGLSVEIDNFSEEMQYLYDEGYDSISLGELFNASDKKTVVLTFDDGYKDVYENAYPIMKEYNLTGTVFVITDFVGNDGYMSWSDLKKLSDAGWKIESHTESHPNLTNISAEDAWQQIYNSKIEVEANIGDIVTFFSYPAGKYNDEVVDLVKKAGYSGAISTDQGIENNINKMYNLKRERVGGYSELQDFIGLLKIIK